MALGSLTIDIAANVARLRRDMEEANRTVSGAMGRIENSARKAKLAMEGLAVGFGAIKLAGWVKNAVDSADAMQQLSKRTGVAVEDLSLLKIAIEQSGGSFDALSTGLTKLEQNMAKAGVSGDQTIAVIEKIADRMAKTQDPAKRIAIAMDAFGKAAGPELVEFLSQGGHSIDELVAKLKKMGLAMSGETAAAADDLKDKMALLKVQMDAAALAISGGFVKAMADFNASGISPQGLQSLRDFGELVGNLTKIVVENAREIAKWAGVYIGITRGISIGRIAGAPGMAIGGAVGGVAGYFLGEKLTGEHAGFRGAGATGTWGEPAAKKGGTTAAANAYVAGLGQAAEGQKKLKAMVDQSAEAIQKELDSQREQLALLPLSADAQERYKLASMGATRAQQEQGAALVQARESLQRSIDEQREYNQVIAEGVHQEIEYAANVRERLDAIRHETELLKLPERERAIQQQLEDLNLKPWDPMAKEAENLIRVKTAMRELRDQTDALGDAFVDAFGRAIQGGDSFGDILRGLAIDILKITTAPIERFLSESLSNLIREHVPLPGLQHGGPAYAGFPYIVGERGPELFMPRITGSVLSHDVMKRLVNRSGARPINISNTYNSSGRVTQEDKRTWNQISVEMGKSITRSLKRNS